MEHLILSRSVLTAQFVESAVGLLISRFIPLTEDDLNEWLADPEAWVNTEDTESDMWQYELRVWLLLSFAVNPLTTRKSHISHVHQTDSEKKKKTRRYTRKVLQK